MTHSGALHRHSYLCICRVFRSLYIPLAKLRFYRFWYIFNIFIFREYLQDYSVYFIAIDPKTDFKKLDGYNTRMLCAVLNKSWKQHPTKLELYDHFPPITQIKHVRRTAYLTLYWRRDELICDVLFWTATHGHTIFGQSTNTSAYLKTLQLMLTRKLATSEGWKKEREREREREREHR